MCFPELGAQYVCASKVSRNGLAKEEALVRLPWLCCVMLLSQAALWTLSTLKHA